MFDRKIIRLKFDSNYVLNDDIFVKNDFVQILFKFCSNFEHTTFRL